MPRDPKGRTDFSRLDWQRPEVGRLTTRVAAVTVTDDASRDAARTQWRRYMALLDRLYAERQLDVLYAIKRGPKNGGLALTEVAAEILRSGDFGVRNLMERLVLRRDLWAVLGAAHARLGKTADTRKRYATTFTKLVKLGVVRPPVQGKVVTTVAELERIDWLAVRARWTVTKGYGERARTVPASAADWNHLVRFISAALTDLFGGGRTGRDAAFRKRVLDRLTMERERSREVTLTVEQFLALVAALPAHVRPAIYTLAITGIRLGEYLALTPDALDAAVPCLRVEGYTGAEVVKVEPTLWPWIVAAVPPPARSPNGLRAPLRRAAAAIGYPGLRLHDLRHFSATAAMAAGASLADVRDQLRHADAKTTMGYLKGLGKQRHAAAIARALAPDLRATGGQGA